MAGINRGVAGGEKRYQRGLWLLQMKNGFVIATHGHPFEIPIPRSARVDAKFGSRLVEQHVPGALHVIGRKRLPIVPANALAKVKCQFGAVLVPRPCGGEIRHDRLDRVLRHMLVEDDEIVEHRHHRRDRGDRYFLESGHAGGAVAMGDPQHAARLLRGRWSNGRRHYDQQPGDYRREPQGSTHYPHSPITPTSYLSSQTSSKRHSL